MSANARRIGRLVKRRMPRAASGQVMFWRVLDQPGDTDPISQALSIEWFRSFFRRTPISPEQFRGIGGRPGDGRMTLV